MSGFQVLGRKSSSEVSQVPHVALYTPPQEKIGLPLEVITSAKAEIRHPDLYKLTTKRFKFLSNRGVNGAYQKLINFAQEISLRGHTDGSILMLKDLTRDFKEAAQEFIADFNDPEIRRSRGISDDAARKISSQFRALHENLKEIVAGIKEVLKLKPVPESRQLPGELKDFDARRLPLHTISSFFSNIKSRIGERIDEKYNLYRKAEIAKNEAINQENDSRKISSRKEGRFGSNLFNLFGRQDRKIEILHKKVATAEEAAKAAKFDYAKTLQKSGSAIYSRLYGMKVTAYDSTPKSILYFMRPLSSEQKDLSYDTLINKVVASIKKLSAGYPEGFQYMEYSHNSISVSRKGEGGVSSELTIIRSSHPGKCIIKIDGSERLCGWNDNVYSLVTRFLQGKELKYKVRTPEERKVIAEDMIFKPVDLAMQKVCEKLNLSKAA